MFEAGGQCGWSTVTVGDLQEMGKNIGPEEKKLGSTPLAMQSQGRL